MTTATFFTAPTPASMGQPSPVRAVARKAQASQTVRPSAPAATARATYPWMTQAMLGKLSARALRLMRADY